jgi:hypothetical protein
VDSRQICCHLVALLPKKGGKNYPPECFTNLCFYAEDKYAAETWTTTKMMKED